MEELGFQLCQDLNTQKRAKRKLGEGELYEQIHPGKYVRAHNPSLQVIERTHINPNIRLGISICLQMLLHPNRKIKAVKASIISFFLTFFYFIVTCCKCLKGKSHRNYMQQETWEEVCGILNHIKIPVILALDIHLLLTFNFSLIHLSTHLLLP